MRPGVNRLLRVLAIAPVTALVAVAPATVAHAQASPGSTAPSPYVVCVDPGHGGAPDNSDPSKQFDPGAIGVGGLQEKGIALDIGLGLRTLLERDGVTVAMTRADDRFASIAAREQICEDAHAKLFVSIHLNYFDDPAVGGSLVLYPSATYLPFATTMAQSLGRDLAPAHIQSDGTQLRDNWWSHVTMPTVTVEGAYLTNPEEAAWLATSAGRRQLAKAIFDGIETYDPNIAKHKAALSAWTAAHPATTAGGDKAVAGRSQSNAGIVWLCLAGLALAGGLIGWRRHRRLGSPLAPVSISLGRNPRAKSRTSDAAVLSAMLGLNIWRRHQQRRRRRAVWRRAQAYRESRYVRPHVG